MSKAPDAFRTISEVADWLETPAHVLRFWESKFSQVKPVKRAGGRRYYRRNDMLLLGGIKRLLHHDGMTIKDVQKLLRDKGAKHVATLSSYNLDDEPEDIIESTVVEAPAPKSDISAQEPVFHSVVARDDTPNVVPFAREDDQMSFPGFEFTSERRKPVEATKTPEPAKAVAPEVDDHPAAPAPQPIDISGIGDDPDADTVTGTPGILTSLASLNIGALGTHLDEVKTFVDALGSVSVLNANIGKS